MRAVIQRVSSASVAIGPEVAGKIGYGLVILLGIEDPDDQEDIAWLCTKIVHMRIFNDDRGVMNLPILDTGGDLLVISQFTLHAGIKKGNRPSYIRAARPETAIPLYNQFIATLTRLTGKKIETGRFGAMMQVSLVNDGPVTIIADSKHRE